MIVFAFVIFAHFEDEGVEFAANPSDCTVLLRQVGALIEVVGMRKDLLRFFETDAAPRVCSQTLAFAFVEVKNAFVDITVIPFEICSRIRSLSLECRHLAEATLR